MGTTQSEYNGDLLTFFDGDTGERTLPVAPVVFYDDFLGYEPLLTENGSRGIWKTVETNLNTAIALQANEPCGAMALVLDIDNNAEDATLYWGDQKGISLKYGAIFECRLKFTQLPTLFATATFGLAGDYNATKNNIATSVWFRVKGNTTLSSSGILRVETDDATVNNDDQLTGFTLNQNEYYIFRIDCTNLADVKFYLNGVRLLTTTTFSMSALTDNGAVMQPFISLDKPVGASELSILLDYVRVWSKRSA
jgi:hypothetical protein